MLDQNYYSDSDVGSAEHSGETAEPDAEVQNGRGVSVLFQSHLNVLATDEIVPRECLPALMNAQLVLATAQENAALIIQRANQEALLIKRKAEVDGQEWLDNKQREMFAQMHFQQTEWLSRLQPFWMEALERTLRKLCGGLARPEVFACAIDAGLSEFKDLSDLHIDVNPDDLNVAVSAAARLTPSTGLLAVSADASVEPGSCRLRNANFEVTLHLDRAIDLALEKS